MHVEPEFEAWMRRLVPGCDQHWIGASPEEIEALEEYASHPLPPFYQWFLAKMGRSMGPIAVSKCDTSVSTILSLYEDGLTTINPDLLLIGVQLGEAMPAHLFYDLGRQTRNDAWVCRGTLTGGSRYEVAETLRESLAWTGFVRFRRQECLYKATGMMRHSAGVLETLHPTLAALQFSKVIPAGAFCGIYDRADIGLDISIIPSETEPEEQATQSFMLFEAVGDDEAVIRSVLGTLDAETPVEVKINEWVRPLP